MLSTLIYRSRMSESLQESDLPGLLRAARGRNEERGVTGILLFDGAYFLQMLEGPEEAVQALFARISRDPRHGQVVLLLEDHAPRRRFPKWGMRLVDVRAHPQGLLDATLAGGMLRGAEARSEDRPFRLMQAFAAGRWREHAAECVLPETWRWDVLPAPFARLSPPERTEDVEAPCRFALQPIVDTARGRVSSLEALIRSPQGGPPQACFAGMGSDALYRFDLESKRHAFALASRIGLGACKLSINLLPMALVSVPDAVGRLVAQIEEAGLKPQQVMVEVTEDEAISHFEAFAVALKGLRAAGIGVAIDDFGAGFAGLSLLSRFQPDRLKIDRQIVTGIDADGPRQAIVRAIVECCRALGIATVAEGVERVEEWCWLQAAGVEFFQGYLFARPGLECVPDINWPVLR